MGMYELNEKIAFACGKGFKFNQINNFKIKICSNLSHEKYTLSAQVRFISIVSSIFQKTITKS